MPLVRSVVRDLSSVFRCQVSVQVLLQKWRSARV